MFEKIKKGSPDVVQSEVLESTDEPVKAKTSNRKKFVQAFYVVAILWFFVLVFALGGIWAPPTLYGLAGNFSATAWLIAIPNAFFSALLMFCAEEFMDVE